MNTHNLLHTYPDDDLQYEDVKLKSVKKETEGWSVVREDGWSFYVPENGVVPEVGQIARFYGKGIGYTVRGLFLNGQKVFYRTEDEDRKAHENWVSAEKQRKQEAFFANKEKHDARIAALPEVFQRRLKKFQDTNPDFRWEFEDYELMVCEQAVLFATTFPTLEALEKFKKSDWKDQVKACPGIDEGHSDNSLACAIRLAYHYLTNKENVFREHGALVPLVGCKAYGCPHPESVNNEEDEDGHCHDHGCGCSH
jgi:hypothetical protein